MNPTHSSPSASATNRTNGGAPLLDAQRTIVRERVDALQDSGFYTAEQADGRRQEINQCSDLSTLADLAVLLRYQASWWGVAKEDPVRRSELATVASMGAADAPHLLSLISGRPANPPPPSPSPTPSITLRPPADAGLSAANTGGSSEETLGSPLREIDSEHFRVRHIDGMWSAEWRDGANGPRVAVIFRDLTPELFRELEGSNWRAISSANLFTSDPIKLLLANASSIAIERLSMADVARGENPLRLAADRIVLRDVKIQRSKIEIEARELTLAGVKSSRGNLHIVTEAGNYEGCVFDARTRLSGDLGATRLDQKTVMRCMAYHAELSRVDWGTTEEWRVRKLYGGLLASSGHVSGVISEVATPVSQARFEKRFEQSGPPYHWAVYSRRNSPDARSTSSAIRSATHFRAGEPLSVPRLIRSPLAVGAAGLGLLIGGAYLSQRGERGSSGSGATRDAAVSEKGTPDAPAAVSTSGAAAAPSAAPAGARSPGELVKRKDDELPSSMDDWFAVSPWRAPWHPPFISEMPLTSSALTPSAPTPSAPTGAPTVSEKVADKVDPVTTEDPVGSAGPTKTAATTMPPSDPPRFDVGASSAATAPDGSASGASAEPAKATDLSTEGPEPLAGEPIEPSVSPLPLPVFDPRPAASPSDGEGARTPAPPKSEPIAPVPAEAPFYPEPILRSDEKPRNPSAVGEDARDDFSRFVSPDLRASFSSFVTSAVSPTAPKDNAAANDTRDVTRFVPPERRRGGIIHSISGDAPATGAPSAVAHRSVDRFVSARQREAGEKLGARPAGVAGGEPLTADLSRLVTPWQRNVMGDLAKSLKGGVSTPAGAELALSAKGRDVSSK